MLRIHHKNIKTPIKYCLFTDNKYYRGDMIELKNGFEFTKFQYYDNSVIRGYVNHNQYIIISIYDTCWCGKHPIPRDVIFEHIEIFTNTV